MDSNDRSRRLLAALVREYIDSGAPVASSTLADTAGLGVSPATVRNILARLEEDGFVQQPHTSAGRVPTDKAYRVYVDLILESRRSGRTASVVEARLRRDHTAPHVDSMLTHVTHVISQTSRQLGFVMTPSPRSAVFDRLEFIPLDSFNVLVVIVARGGHVVQKVVNTGEPNDPAVLRQAAAYLNQEFSGLPLHRAREAVVERMREERMLYDELMARAIRLASSTFQEMGDDRTVFIDGASALVGEGQGLTIGALQTLLFMIDEKERLVRLLNACIDGPGLTVVIGAEHTEPTLHPFSLIASTYEDEAGLGMVGVIGPTRMRYSRAIAVVDAAAQAVSRVLRHPN